MSHETGPLRSDEEPAVAGLLGRAFRDNPLNVRVFATRSPGRRARRGAHGLRPHLAVARRAGQVLVLREAGRPLAALSGGPPGGYPLPPAPLVLRLVHSLRQGTRASALWAEVDQVVESLHPLEDHATLATLGVEPERQGEGLGHALLGSWLRTLPADAPTFLATDRERNLAFYARAGFAVERELAILGVPVWWLRRPAPEEA